MSIIKFENLPVTTMTALIMLNGSVDIKKVFGLLEMAKFANIENFRATKKQKIPICDRPGSLITATFGKKTRGFVKSEVSTGWRNSIMIDIATKCKNVNIKLSQTTIHMCGSVSVELCHEVGEYIIEHIKNVQVMLDRMKENPELCAATIEWIKENIAGDDYVVDANTDQILDIKEGVDNDGFLFDSFGNPFISEILTSVAMDVDYSVDECGQILDPSQQHLYLYSIQNVNYIGTLNSIVQGWPELAQNLADVAKKPIHIVRPKRVKSLKIPEAYYVGYPDHIDSQIAKFLLDCLPDYQYCEDYVNFIEEVLQYDRVYVEPLTIRELFPLMVNYSYSLGFCIDRSKLSNMIHGNHGFYAFYNNTTDHCVKIILPYVPTDAMKAIDNLRYNKDQKKKRKYQHSFMVYKSGLVTQSGPNMKMVEHAYNKFNTLLRQNLQDIMQPNGQLVIKYRCHQGDSPYITPDQINARTIFQPIDLSIEEVEKDNIFDQGDQGDQEDFLDFMELFEIYWDIIEKAQQKAPYAIQLFKSLVPNEQIEIAKLNQLLHLKLIQKLAPFVEQASRRVCQCLALGRATVMNMYLHPNQISNLSPQPDLDNFMCISDIQPDSTLPEDDIITQQIEIYWNTFMLK